VHDVGLETEPRAVVEEALQHPRGDDAAAADQHGPGPGLEELVDVLVRLVGVDDVLVVARGLPERLQVGQEPQPRVADRQVHEAGPERDPLGRGGALGRGEDREVAAADAPAHQPDHPLDEHVVVADPLALPLEAGEDGARARASSSRRTRAR
jgi:hypothetical protein